jgi:FkbM family methyltransferase
MNLVREVRDQAFAALTMRKTYVEVEGVKLGLDGASPRMRYVMCHGYEGTDANLARQLLTAEDRVLEVGAATGFMAIYCTQRIGVRQYCMVEASPEILPTIRRNFALNGVAMPTLIHAAVSGEDGPVAFHVHRNFWSSSVLDCEGSQPVKVSGRSLPSLVADLPWEPTALIMDAEGCEASIPLPHFRAFRKLVIEVHPKLIGEDRAAELLVGLASMGFREVNRSGGSYAFVREGGVQ